MIFKYHHFLILLSVILISCNPNGNQGGVSLNVDSNSQNSSSSANQNTPIILNSTQTKFMNEMIADFCTNQYNYFDTMSFDVFSGFSYQLSAAIKSGATSYVFHIADAYGVTVDTDIGNGFSRYEDSFGILILNRTSGQLTFTPNNVKFNSYSANSWGDGGWNITITDSFGNKDKTLLLLKIKGIDDIPLKLNDVPPQTGRVGQAFNLNLSEYAKLADAYPTYPYFVVESGTLPSGLTMNVSTGVIQGTPSSTAAGTYNLTIRVYNPYPLLYGQYIDLNFQMTISN